MFVCDKLSTFLYSTEPSFLIGGPGAELEMSRIRNEGRISLSEPLGGEIGRGGGQFHRHYAAKPPLGGFGGAEPPQELREAGGRLIMGGLGWRSPPRTEKHI